MLYGVMKPEPIRNSYSDTPHSYVNVRVGKLYKSLSRAIARAKKVSKHGYVVDTNNNIVYKQDTTNV